MFEIESTTNRVSQNATHHTLLLTAISNSHIETKNKHGVYHKAVLANFHCCFKYFHLFVYIFVVLKYSSKMIKLGAPSWEPFP